MKFALIIYGILIINNCFGQINHNDSTVQVVGYWAKNESVTYRVNFDTYKTKGADTINRTSIKYDVQVTIKDSTATSYLIEWYYKNYITETDNEVINKMAALAKDMSVIIKTDEFGAVQEVVNWKDVSAYLNKAIKKLKKQVKKNRAMVKALDQVLTTYSTKEGIETNAIKDILQFYTFHGGKYILNNEVKGQIKLFNNYGGNPFDADVKVFLEEINFEDDNSILRMLQHVDEVQLTNATYNYLKQTGTLGDKLPPIEEFPTVYNEIWTASRIHGSTGWIIYSVETKEVSSQGVTNVEERSIQIL